MSELILLIFFLHIVIYLVTDLGADTINALVCCHFYSGVALQQQRSSQ